MTSMPGELLSIVIVSFNARDHLRRCLTTLSVTNYHVAMIMGAEVCVEDL